MEVTVAEGSPVTDIAFLAPAILGEILSSSSSLYFYLATRQNIRMSILSLCVTRRLRWRTAHVFRDVETKVSRFLLSVTFLNICVGVVMTLATWWLGLPSPLLWGALAFILNYIPYVGQAILIAILLAVGLGTQVGLGRDPRAGRGLPRRQLHRGAGGLPALRRAVGDAQPVPHLPLDHLLDLGLGAVRRAGRGAVAAHPAVVPRATSCRARRSRRAGRCGRPAR